ncbi:hypothetical protein F4818DRAFT_436940 [Hypoxylon cercidicola]|nr:hypothetical protein F4818DRAFT_436940 [Hypoxylon cercidicola]
MFLSRPSYFEELRKSDRFFKFWGVLTLFSLVSRPHGHPLIRDSHPDTPVIIWQFLTCIAPGDRLQQGGALSHLRRNPSWRNVRAEQHEIPGLAIAVGKAQEIDASGTEARSLGRGLGYTAATAVRPKEQQNSCIAQDF